MNNLLDTFLFFVALACLLWLAIALHDYLTLNARRSQYLSSRRDWDAEQHRHYHRR